MCHNHLQYSSSLSCIIFEYLCCNSFMAISKLVAFFTDATPFPSKFSPLNLLRNEFCLSSPTEGGERWCGELILSLFFLGFCNSIDCLFYNDSILVDLYELMDPSDGLDMNKLMDLTELMDCKDLMSAMLPILEVSSLFEVTLLILQFFFQGCSASSNRKRLCLDETWALLLLLVLCFFSFRNCSIYFSIQVSSFLRIVFSFRRRFILLEQKAFVSFTQFLRKLIFYLRSLDLLTIDPLLLIQVFLIMLYSFRRLFALSFWYLTQSSASLEENLFSFASSLRQLYYNLSSLSFVFALFTISSYAPQSQAYFAQFQVCRSLFCYTLLLETSAFLLNLLSS